MSADEQPAARAVLVYVAATDLFTIPDVLVPFAIADEVLLEGNAGEDPALARDAMIRQGWFESGEIEIFGQ